MLPARVTLTLIEDSSYSIFSVSVDPVRILSPRLNPGDGVSGPFIDLISEAEVEGGTDGLL